MQEQHNRDKAVFAAMQDLGIYQHLDRHEFTIGIFLDLQKALDTVNHDILLYKLYNCGVKELLINGSKVTLVKGDRLLPLEIAVQKLAL